jgi:hypothetical protein
MIWLLLSVSERSIEPHRLTLCWLLLVIVGSSILGFKVLLTEITFCLDLIQGYSLVIRPDLKVRVLIELKLHILLRIVLLLVELLLSILVLLWSLILSGYVASELIVRTSTTIIRISLYILHLEGWLLSHTRPTLRLNVLVISEWVVCRLLLAKGDSCLFVIVRVGFTLIVGTELILSTIAVVLVLLIRYETHGLVDTATPVKARFRVLTEWRFEQVSFLDVFHSVSLLRESERIIYWLMCSLALYLHIRIIFLIV